MRAISTGQTQLVKSQGRSTQVDVRVYNTTTSSWVSLRSLFGFNFIRTVNWQENIDDNGRTATITLDRNIYNFSLSPYIQTHRIWDTYGNLININIPIKIFVALKGQQSVPSGVSDPDWMEVFWGRIYQIDFASNAFNLSCRDWLDQLQSLWMENSSGIVSVAGNFSAQTIMQYLLNYANGMTVNFIPGLTGANLQLTTLYSANGTAGTPFLNSVSPDDPGWVIGSTDPYPTSLMTIWTALDNINQQIGWTLRQSWNANINGWALTWKDPLRTNTTSMYTFIPAQYINITTCSIHLGDLRNVVQIWYNYGGTLNGTGIPSVYTQADNTSIAQYGRQFMQVGTDATFAITGATQTTSGLPDYQSMAQNALSDLSQPLIDFSVDVPLFPFVELNDLYTFSADDRHFSNNQTLAVISYSHSIDSQSIGTTTLGVRGKPSGGVARWLSRQVQNFTKRVGAANSNTSSDQGGNLTSNSSFTQFTRY